MPASPFPFRLDFPPELPISARADEIVATLEKNQVLILAGDTGSGKTTQIPKMCLAAGRGARGRIACTQPRRVAALSVSRRVADELGVSWGREVGCKVRFNDHTSRETVIKFLTDGMLLAEVQSDPLLREYDTIIVDEAHERSLNIDFLLGHLRQLRFSRPELKIVITSATIDTAQFSKAFDDAPVIEVSGRAYPVEVIYAPLDELGSDRAEGDGAEAKAEAMHYIDGAVEAVERILGNSQSGDVLVFMPAERDIREARELIEGRYGKFCEIVPLFGRLSNAEQQRVFAPSQRRKIVIATNIAETSLTIPGIHYVVDTGLARVSRYVPQARTRRLPIEEISQSSADQRKGRCGRVAAGVCIRLYSEKDYNERPRFAQPEIQRANLADVILRMKAFRLGDIERFPFINAPATKAVRAGYALLEELGAIASADGGAHDLTPLGEELARLPVDPTVGRMILQAREERCVHELLIIAAGLSIQDPRERPLEAKEKADAAHRRFVHPDSDFLTLLNLWDAFHDEVETLSQSRLRRFCRDHFLSYTRVREWRDIHAQLLEVLSARDDFKVSSTLDGLSPAAREKDSSVRLAWGTAAYRAIHRAILSGLLSNIAVRDEETGLYRAPHDRRVAIFPGSTLFARDDAAKRRDNASREKKAKAPRWILAAEIMETARLYARTCARLDPTWVLQLGAHLLKISHAEPFWNVEQGRVLVKQRTRLHGLEIETRAVSFGKIDPRGATEIFIREGLVNDTISWPFDFLAENRRVRARVESLLTRARSSDYMNLDEALYRFYAAQLIDEPETRGEFREVSAVAELVDLVREKKSAQPDFLVVRESDLRDPEETVADAEAFPETLPIENRALPLQYAYKPGQPEDGVTLEVSVRDAENLTEASLDWAVPGHVELKVEHLLRAAPKELRRAFAPLADTARAIAEELRATGNRSEPLTTQLDRVLARRFRIAVETATWTARGLPEHLRVRVRVRDEDGREVVASRELAAVQAALDSYRRELSQNLSREDPSAWQAARRKWETPEQTEWVFGDVPSEIQIAEQGGVPVNAYPALVAGEKGVALRLRKTREEAEEFTAIGWSRLLELQLRYELAWLQKDLRALRELGALPATLTSIDELQAQAFTSLRQWAIGRDAADAGWPGAERGPVARVLTQSAFAGAVDEAKRRLRAIVPKLVVQLREILEVRQALLVHPQPYPGLADDLAALLPSDFLGRTSFPRLAHLARYVRGLKLRADRWKQNPAKDGERARALAPYLAAAKRLEAENEPVAAAVFRAWVEEYRLSLFAQEIGTAESVSPAKLDRVLAGFKGEATPRTAPAASSAPAASPPPAPARPVPAEKAAPVKSLGALDRLFQPKK